MTKLLLYYNSEKEPHTTYGRPTYHIWSSCLEAVVNPNEKTSITGQVKALEKGVSSDSSAGEKLISPMNKAPSLPEATAVDHVKGKVPESTQKPSSESVVPPIRRIETFRIRESKNHRSPKQ